MKIEEGEGWALICGDWRDPAVQREIERRGPVDSVITDPPYSARTHDTYDAAACATRAAQQHDAASCTPLGYAALTPDDARELAAYAGDVARGWVAIMSDHVLVPCYARERDDPARYGFAPLPILQRAQARVLGDGPASWAVYLSVSRPRDRAWLRAWQTSRKNRGLSCSLPGCYEAMRARVSGVMGAKTVALMRDVIDDYSEPGDMILDVCAGSGTTLSAARAMGRRAIGIEIDPETHALAAQRLRSIQPGADPRQIQIEGLA